MGKAHADESSRLDMEVNMDWKQELRKHLFMARVRPARSWERVGTTKLPAVLTDNPFKVVEFDVTEADIKAFCAEINQGR